MCGECLTASRKWLNVVVEWMHIIYNVPYVFSSSLGSSVRRSTPTHASRSLDFIPLVICDQRPSTKSLKPVDQFCSEARLLPLSEGDAFIDGDGDDAEEDCTSTLGRVGFVLE
ncbi:hypothetical protein KC329_g88 [Hortaea werneckii]|nr:hypothetical protein KC329_g88 [Hortaea werneckii]